MNADDIKVSVAATLGMVTPVAGTFFKGAESVLSVLLMAGQFGVAVLTIVYIAQKIRNHRKK